MKKRCFTLAEVLITIAIIGTISAMTIPALIAKINKIVSDNQIKVFNAKLIKGLNLTKTAGDLNNTYDSTYDFLVNGLGKNLKMAKVCDKDHIRDCVPYDKIKYDYNNDEETVDVESFKTAKDLLIKNTNNTNFKDTAAFVLADGTPAIVTYNLNCIEDSGKADVMINKCIAGIYDLNGSRKPNKYGETISKDEKGNNITTHNSDLQPFNGARIANTALAKIGGVKIMTAATIPTPLTKAECEANKSEYGIYACGYDIDYWAGAVKMCKDQGYKLPSLEQLAAIASVLYGHTFSATESVNSGLPLDSSKIPSAFSVLNPSWFIFWADSEGTAYYASERLFGFGGSVTGAAPRNSSNREVVCVK